MGLLEKALEYKKEINRKGKTTLIDTIKGPAETEMIGHEIQTEESTANTGGVIEGLNQEDISNDLFELPEDDNYSPLDALKEQKSEQTNYDHKHPWIEQGINKKETGEIYTNEEDTPNPLTSEDEPMFPDDINSVIEFKDKSGSLDEQNHSLNMMRGSDKEILEVEPYIINDDPENTESDVNLTSEPEPFINTIKTGINPAKENEMQLKKSDEMDNISDKKYKENMTLYEISKEISRSETKKELFEVVIFSIMGQIGTSVASIMIKNPENDKWIIVNSSGLKSREKTFSFDVSAGILKNVKKDIIDIEKYKDDPDYIDNYRELNSISVRLLIPWYFKGKVLGILALGNKITDDDYTAEEKDFIQAICESSAIELNKINTIEKLKTENESSNVGLNFLQHINNIQEKIIINNSLKKVNDIIKSEFEGLGIIDYSVFVNNTIRGKYIPIITSKNADYSPGSGIDNTNQFVSFIQKKKTSHRIEDYNKSEIVKGAFNEIDIKKMSVLWVYPFELGDQLIGFIAIFNVKDELLNEDKKSETDNKLDKLSKMVLSNIINIIHIDPDENRYTDNIETIFNKINSDLLNSQRLNIPLTLIIFSIKNYKRYGNIFGYAKSKELIDNFAELIKGRLSETDYSARYDRNKILVVLPGKDKKFAAPFANTIRIEFMQRFKKNEMQLLTTFLISEYPEDGNDILSLIDSIN